MQRRDDGGLGTQLIGDKIAVNHRNVQVMRLLGEGGFSYVYLAKDLSDPNKSDNSTQQSNQPDHNSANGSGKDRNPVMVLKVTSIHSRAQRDIAEKEAKLLSRLSHPSIIKMYDWCYRTTPQNVGVVGSIIGGGGGGGGNKDLAAAASKDGRPQHIILMEYCEGGHALDVCNKLASAGQRFDLAALIIAFGQICNAVSYLHAQRPPIVHRDLKPVNFLVKNGAYKLCDFGSAVFGHVELKSPQARQEADEVIQKTTTQMFRAPEMVDLLVSNKLTQSTDVWALGCCLYSLAFLQNCFEEGSNLAIISRKYKIPDDNPYGDGLVELIDRMLTVDDKERSDMTEVILCLSAIYSGRPLPPRRKVPKAKKKEAETHDGEEDEDGKRPGAYRTDGQGILEKKKKKKKETPSTGKKLATNSAAARRLRGRQVGDPSISPGPSPGNYPSPGGGTDMFEASFSAFAIGHAVPAEQELTFTTDTSNFADAGGAGDGAAFGSFDGEGREDNARGFDAFGSARAWGSGQAAQLQKSGTVTADGFPAAFAGREDGAPSDTSDALAVLLQREADMAARLENLKLSEALRRAQDQP